VTQYLKGGLVLWKAIVSALDTECSTAFLFAQSRRDVFEYFSVKAFQRGSAVLEDLEQPAVSSTSSASWQGKPEVH
jgi:hypothetical protein